MCLKLVQCLVSEHQKLIKARNGVTESQLLLVQVVYLSSNPQGGPRPLAFIFRALSIHKSLYVRQNTDTLIGFLCHRLIEVHQYLTRQRIKLLGALDSRLEPTFRGRTNSTRLLHMCSSLLS